MNMIELFLFIIGLIVTCLILMREHNKKSQNAIKDWARLNNVEILKLKYCFWGLSPFTLTKNFGTYRLEVETHDGKIKYYWVGLGVGFSGFRQPYKLTVIPDSDVKKILSWPHTGRFLLYLAVIVLFFISILLTVIKK